MNHSAFTRIVPHARHHFAEETGTMHMATRTRPWTRRDLDRLPDDGNSYEIVRGELFVTPAPRRPHQEIVAALSRRLGPFVIANGLGDVHFPHAVVVLEGSQVEPDLMVRPRQIPPSPTWEDAPLPILVIEVLSDVTRRRDLIAKRSLYMEAGIAEYWMVDGERRAITVARPGHSDLVATETLQWLPAKATRALDLDVASVFREALG